MLSYNSSSKIKAKSDGNEWQFQVKVKLEPKDPVFAKNGPAGIYFPTTQETQLVLSFGGMSLDILD